MAPKRKRRDANHHPLVAVFEQLGCTVFDTSDIGGGFPDLMVGCLGVDRMVELKNPDSRYGRAGLNANQREFVAGWRGGAVHVALTPDDVIALVAKWRAR